jgi:DNA-directed RNA polymerase specialized sigma24 family protein
LPQPGDIAVCVLHQRDQHATASVLDVLLELRPGCQQRLQAGFDVVDLVIADRAGQALGVAVGVEADDAVQEAWLRLSRAQPDEIENLRAWLPTMVARVCLDMLRSRRSRHEEPLSHQSDQLDRRSRHPRPARCHDLASLTRSIADVL